MTMAIKTGIVRDDRFLAHNTGQIHPEHPTRLKSVYKMLDAEFAHGLIRIEPQLAPLEYLEFVHTPMYIEKVLKTANHQFTSLAPDTPASENTWHAASLAVGGCISGLDALVDKTCEVCFSLVRPPGHHALADRAAGFCVFNNLGITARYAAQRHHFKRILIIDWDIHHGNGLQEMFYDSSAVLYFSTHDTRLYPYSGDWAETGTGNGQGYTVNVPIPRNLTDADFFHLYRILLADMIAHYRPELIFVAAGFDAHRLDPIGRSALTEYAFSGLMHLILDLKKASGDPPVLMALEGGYHPRALAECVRAVLTVLTTKQNPSVHIPETSQRVKTIVKKTRTIHAPHRIWTH
ncbi:histone deacetylase [Desulfosarcina ovata subsp. sediminis]|uniref:Histone deacetylase n=2 Tax=Desulfosarcina ovata TaxID=83564 RepID=A0A5K7ZL46_9BACT|nr:histone deacetylase [Desulfosarcina ovata subsp. sediminis]